MIVLKGLQGPVTVKGQQYGTAVMQSRDKTLTDQKIADVCTSRTLIFSERDNAVG
jgi:hypothetical protein